MINIESMKIDKNNIYVNIIFISIFLIFLDAYEIFSIPISWIGLSFLLIPSVIEGKAILKNGYIKNICILVILISIPQIFFLFNNEFDSSYSVYILFKYFFIYFSLLLFITFF